MILRGKKRKLGKGNLYLTENRLSRNKMLCVAICVTYVQRFLDSKFNDAVIDKISNIQEINPKISNFHKNHSCDHPLQKSTEVG